MRASWLVVLVAASCGPPVEEGASPASGAAATQSKSIDITHCPYPEEAYRERVAYGEALLEIDIDAEGRATHVSVLSEAEPGFGFGAAAERCAFGTRWPPLRDSAGNAIAQRKKLRVVFDASR